MINVIPVSVPMIDWDGIKSLSDFVVAVTRLTDKTSSKRIIMRKTSDVLRHLSFSFLIQADEPAVLFSALNRGNFAITVATDFKSAIVTGTLLDWKSAIEVYCVESETTDIRRFYDAVLIFLTRIGLHDLWDGRYKPMMPDQTFYLE